MKRMISLLLVFTMMASILPAPSFGEEFFSEESFGAATFEDETFFEDEDFSAFFAAEEPEEEIAAADLFDESFATEELADEVFSTEALSTETETVEEAADPTSAEVLAAESETEAATAEEAGTEADAAIEPEVSAEDDTAAVPAEADAPEADETANEDAIAESGLFSEGYAKVAKDTELFKDENATEKLGVFAEDSVVYATARVTRDEEDDLLAVRFVAEEREYDAFILADAAAPLTAEEAAELTEALAMVAFESEVESRGIELEIEELESRAAISTLQLVDTKTYYPGSSDQYISLGLIWEQYSSSSITSYEIRYSTNQSDLNDPSCPSITIPVPLSASNKYFDPISSITYASYENDSTIKFSTNTYYFTVVPMNGSLALEGLSNIVSWTPKPADVYELKALPVAGQSGKIRFEWTNMNTKGITGYLLYHNSVLQKTYNKTTNDPEYDTLSYYVDSKGKQNDFTTGKTYTFKLYTYIDKNSNGKYDEGTDLISNGKTVVYTVPPTAPIITKAVNRSTTSTEVYWTGVDGVNGYRVYYYVKEEGLDEETYIDVGKSINSYVIKGLTPLKTYCFVIRSYIETNNPVYDEDGEQTGTSPVKTFSDTSNIIEKKCLPGVVEGVNATYDTTAKEITIKWSKQEDSNITGYRVFYVIDDVSKLDPSDASTVALPTPTTYFGSNTTTTSISNPTLGARYYFKIIATYANNDGVFNDAIVFPQSGLEIIPGKVLNLEAASAGYSGSSCTITLNWDKITGVDGYRIQRSTKPFATASATEITEVTVTPDTTTTYTDTGLTLGQTYYYRVLAYKKFTAGTGNAEGSWSDVVTAMGSPSDPATASISQYATKPESAVENCGLSVNWSKVTEGVDGYKVTLIDAYTDTAVQSDVLVAGSDNTSHNFFNLKAGEPYYAIIKSYIGSAVSPGKKTSILTPALWVPQTAKPYSFTIDPVDATSIKVIWPPFKGVTGYFVNVEADTVNPVDGTFQKIENVKVTTNNYTIKGMKTGYKYKFTVASYSDAQGRTVRSDDTSTWVYNPSGYETIVYDSTGSPTLVAADYSQIVQATPNQVTGLKLTINYDADQKPYAQLSWKKIPGLDELNGGYLVYRNGTLIATLKGEQTNAYKDDLSSSLPGQKITYYVCSYVDMLNKAQLAEYGIGKASAEVSDILGMKALKPEIDNDVNGKIVVKWKTADWMKTYASIKFYIYRAKGSTSFSKAALVSAISPVAYNSTGEYSVTDTTLTVADGKKYYYWVVPADMGTPENQFARSSYAMGMVSGQTVSSLTVTAVNARSVTLTWPTTTGATGYVLYRSTDNGATWKKVKALGKKATTYTDKKLSYHQDYLYAISAKYKGGAVSAKKPISTSITTGFSPVTLTDMVVKNANTSKLSWKKVPDATGYRIALYANGEWKTYSTKSNKITIKGLEAGTQYDYYVYPYITWKEKTYPEADASTWSTWSTEYTLSTYLNFTPETGVYIAPKAPTSLKVKKVAAGLANISWKAVSFSGGTVQYLVEYSSDGGVTWNTLADTLNTEYSMTSSLVGKYIFRVTPYYEATGKTFYGTPKTKKATL